MSPDFPIEPSEPFPDLCVVGLGNPGQRYHETRHNIGFRVIDRILARLVASKTGDVGGDEGKQTLYTLDERLVAGRRILFARPQTYMNLSGEAVEAIAREHALTPSQFLVVCDDIALPLGALRLRRRGSSGGQNGLTSVIEALGTDEVPRLRCGIGSVPEGVSAADYVLSPFLAAERASVEAMVEQAADAILSALDDGFDRAMNQYN